MLCTHMLKFCMHVLKFEQSHKWICLLGTLRNINSFPQNLKFYISAAFSSLHPFCRITSILQIFLRFHLRLLMHHIRNKTIFCAFTWCERRGCGGLAGGRCAVTKLAQSGPGHCKNLFNMVEVTSSWPLYPFVVTFECLHCHLLVKTNKPEWADSHDNVSKNTNVN